MNEKHQEVTEAIKRMMERSRRRLRADMAKHDDAVRKVERFRRSLYMRDQYAKSMDELAMWERRVQRDENELDDLLLSFHITCEGVRDLDELEKLLGEDRRVLEEGNFEKLPEGMQPATMPIRAEDGCEIRRPPYRQRRSTGLKSEALRNLKIISLPERL